MDDGGGSSIDRPGVPAGKVSVRGHANQRDLLFLVFAFTGVVVGAGAVCTCVLCGRGYPDADGGSHSDHGGVAADLLVLVSCVRSGGAGVGVRYWDWGESAGAGVAAAPAEAGFSRRVALGGVGEGGASSDGGGRDLL